MTHKVLLRLWGFRLPGEGEGGDRAPWPDNPSKNAGPIDWTPQKSPRAARR